MIKQTGRYVFFVAVYLSGILIGGVFTPDVITYAKQINAQQLEQPELQQKPKRIKKTNTRMRRLG
jgi:hypothetical protein